MNASKFAAQQKQNYNVLTGEKFDETEEAKKTKETLISYLGGDGVPVVINLYPKDFSSKELVLDYLYKYNDGKPLDEQILYTDLGEIISTLSGSIMDAITIVLIAFSSISIPNPF